MMTITCDEFLEGVKRLVTVPSNQNLLTDESILGIATSRLRSTLIPLLDGTGQDFFIMKTPVPILQGVENYSIPPRAIGRKLREIKLINDAGVRCDFPKINIEREHLYQSNASPYGFHFYGDRVQLVPIPAQSGGFIQLWWGLSPGRLVSTNAAGLITAINGDTATVNATPAAFSPGRRIDFIQGQTGNRCLAIDVPIDSIVGPDITFAAGLLPADAALGDYIALAGESPVLQIPEEAQPYLEVSTAYDALYALSDFEGQKALKDTMMEHKENLLSLLSPRVTGEPDIIINDRGQLRGRMRRNHGILFRS